MKLLPKIIARSNPDQERANIRRALLHMGAKIGGEAFGPIPEGHRREFFCLDERTWIWHEEWLDATNKRHIVTTRYDVRPDGILKSQGSNSYQRISHDEAKNLYRAARLYNERFGAELRRMAQFTGNS